MNDLSQQIGDILSQPAFYWGVAAALLGFLLLWLAGVIAAEWNKIIQFFVPSKAPPLPPARTPWQRLMSCLGALFILCLMLVAFIAALVWLMTNA